MGSCDLAIYTYRNLLSKRPPPIFDDPMLHIYIHVRYTYKWLLRVSAHPRFWPVNFKYPRLLTRENQNLDNIMCLTLVADPCLQQACLFLNMELLVAMELLLVLAINTVKSVFD